MSAPERRREAGPAGAGTIVLWGLAGATAAAWLWNARGEDELRRRTEQRLRPFAQRTPA